MMCRTEKMRRCRADGRYKAREKAADLKRRQEKPFALKAKWMVRKAVERGELPHIKTLKCLDCGKQATCYDHRDYSYPLRVDPVCFSCNAFRGPAINP